MSDPTTSAPPTNGDEFATGSEGAGLYLHLPYCSAICPYCDFAVATGNAAAKQAFVNALIREIEAGRRRELSFETVYFGGGTPSALTDGQFERIVEALRRTYALDRARWALEANPEDVDRTSLAAWSRLGFSTVSLGVQGFSEQRLKFLGRRHGGSDARRAVEAALASDLTTVSLDLIYGLPDERPEVWRGELEAAVALAPHHISAYQLTVHSRTPFGRLETLGRLHQLDDERQAELFFLTHRTLEAAGYPAYEVSNFARRPEHRSLHNQKYWSHQPYLGLGPRPTPSSVGRDGGTGRRSTTIWSWSRQTCLPSPGVRSSTMRLWRSNG